MGLSTWIYFLSPTSGQSETRRGAGTRVEVTCSRRKASPPAPGPGEEPAALSHRVTSETHAAPSRRF